MVANSKNSNFKSIKLLENASRVSFYFFFTLVLILSIAPVKNSAASTALLTPKGMPDSQKILKSPQSSWSSDRTVNQYAYALKTINSLNTIIADMQKLGEAKPQGVSASVDWASGPRVGMGNDPKGFRAMIAWGQVYEPTQGNPAANTRVQLRNIKAYMLSKKNGKWHLLQSSVSVEGAAYRADFADDINKPAEIRYEKDGSISVKAGKGYNFHFWCSNGRATIDPQDVAGIFTTVEARLIVDNPQKPDDRAQARYILSMGGDYWLNLTAAWDNFKTNGYIGIGRFKYVKQNWRAFNMSTLSADELRRNPPPIQ